MEEFHVIHDPEHDSWCVSKDIVRVECFSERADAIDRGAELARRSRGGHLTIHTQAGSIETVRVYGAGPE